MEEFQNHNLEYMVEDYHEMTDFDDIVFEDTESPREGVDGYFDSDCEDFELVSLTDHLQLY